MKTFIQTIIILLIATCSQLFAQTEAQKIQLDSYQQQMQKLQSNPQEFAKMKAIYEDYRKQVVPANILLQEEQELMSKTLSPADYDIWKRNKTLQMHNLPQNNTPTPQPK